MQSISNEISNTESTKFTFKSNNRIDICDKKLSKDILVTLELDSIKIEDNLESIAFEIEYDMSIFRFDNVFTSNTLLGDFEFIDYAISNNEGLIVIDAGNTTIGKKVFGNKLFLALSGKSLSDNCTKDGFIRVNRVLFNDEYKRKNVINETFFIENNINPLNASKWFGNCQDSLLFDTNEVKKSFNYNLNFESDFKYFNFKIQQNIGNYSITDINVDNENIILAKGLSNNIYDIKATNINKVTSFNLIFEITKNEIDTNTYKFEIGDLKFEDCNCNLNSEFKSLFISQIKYNKDTIDSNNTSINKTGKTKIFNINNSILKVDNLDLSLKYLKIWNINGDVLHSFDLKETSNVIINLEQEKNKVLILQFIYKDNTYYTEKVIIQN